MAFFCRNRKPNSKFHMQFQGIRADKIILEKKTKVGVLAFSEIKICYKTTVIKTVQYRCPEGDIDQWNRIGSQKLNPHIYDQLIFDKKLQRMESREVLQNGYKVSFAGEENVLTLDELIIIQH